MTDFAPRVSESRQATHDPFAEVSLMVQMTGMNGIYKPRSYFLRRLRQRRGYFFPRELELLVSLMTDPHPSNRDWATFYVALSSHNSSEITALLLRNAADSHRDTSAEATLGLARRQHAKAYELVSKRLSNEKKIGLLDIKAAGYVASRGLLKKLERVQVWWDTDCPYLRAAIKACENGGRDDYNFD